MPSPRTVFRIVYGASYTFLYVLVVALLLVTPGDAVYQSWKNLQNYNIYIVAICYFLTLLIVSFIYATRLYINKTALAAIPRGWVPIEKGDLHRAVYRLVNHGLDRSAAIAFEARPRMERRDEAPAPEKPTQSGGGETGHGLEKKPHVFRRRKHLPADEHLAVALPPHNPVWGDIEHYGWGSPTSPDLANLQYGTVYSELPNLIEAKALTLAPSDMLAEGGTPTLDPDAVAILQRPVNMSLRDYVGHLARLGVFGPSPNVTPFLSTYEQARFSTRPISNSMFRDLMRLFAELLRKMQPLDTQILEADDAESERRSFSDSDIDNDAPRSGVSRSGTASSRASKIRPPLQTRHSSTGDWRQYLTAPTTPRRTKVEGVSHQPSLDSFAQTRHPYPISQPSSSSLGSKRSEASTPGSVIHVTGGFESA